MEKSCFLRQKAFFFPSVIKGINKYFKGKRIEECLELAAIVLMQTQCLNFDVFLREKDYLLLGRVKNIPKVNNKSKHIAEGHAQKKNIGKRIVQKITCGNDYTAL